MRVCCVCYLYVCVCADLCMCVLETHISALFVFFALLAAAVSRLYYTVPQALKLYGIHFVATAVQQQSHIKLFPCDGHGRCICVRVRAMFHADQVNRNNKKSQERCQSMLRMGQGVTNPHFLPRDCNSNRAATATTTAPALQPLAFVASHGALVFILCVQVLTSRYLYMHSNHHHLYSHPRSTFQSNTRRRTSSCHTAVHQVYSNTRSKSGAFDDDALLVYLRHPRDVESTTCRRGTL